MPTILDRLMGRASEPAPEAKAVVTGNGGSGPGVVVLTYDIPLESLSRNPQKLAAAAQKAYRDNLWVHAAEWAITSRAAGVGFHLEDPDGNTIGDQPGEAHPALDLLMNPAPEQFGRIPSIARRRLKTLTIRHMGLCGYTFWYLDQMEALAGTPRQLIYINPARMMPALDRTGNLIGWIMDGDRPYGRQPVAFKPEEILPFILDPEDDGWLGIGLVEAAWSKIRLSKGADLHATKSLGSGGRKPGIIMPKETKGSFTTDEYNAIVREMRNVTDSPDAAKKSLIFKAPVDYTDAGTTPEQLQLTDLMSASRDDIFAGWGVPTGQSGITTARGLNGGDAYKGDEAVLWQGPIQARLDVYRDTIQSGLLDRYAALGKPVSLVLHTPTFDDDQPKVEMVGGLIRAGFDPQAALKAVGLQPIRHTGLPPVTVQPTPLPGIDLGPPDLADSTDMTAKAKSDPRVTLLGLRKRTEISWEPKLRRAAQQLLGEMAAEVADRAEAKHGHLAKKPKDTGAIFDEAKWTDRLSEVLLGHETDLAGEVSRHIDRGLQREGKAGFLDNVLDFVKRRGAERVKGIVSTTRDLLQQLVGDGIEAGLSPAELGRTIREAAAFDEARAEMIARTEAAYAYNDAAAVTYRQLEVGRVEVIDGDGDEVCASADGQTWTLDEAEANPLGHPNCTRDFVPLLD